MAVLTGTYIAVQCGAWNPSTERLLVGWLFEVVYIPGFLAWFMWSRKDRSQRAAEEAQRSAALTASSVVYEAKSGNSVIYRHGTCVVNHRSSETAAGGTPGSNCASPSSPGCPPPSSTPTPRSPASIEQPAMPTRSGNPCAAVAVSSDQVAGSVQNGSCVRRLGAAMEPAVAVSSPPKTSSAG